jgi:hypothetical protein
MVIEEQFVGIKLRSWLGLIDVLQRTVAVEASHAKAPVKATNLVCSELVGPVGLANPAQAHKHEPA